jgi:hypothetical protein
MIRAHRRLETGMLGALGEAQQCGGRMLFVRAMEADGNRD